MTRNFLKSLGISAEVVDKIMEAHGEGIEREKNKAKTLSEFEEKYNSEKEAHEKTKTEYAEEKANAEMDRAVAAAVRAAGYSEAALPLFLRAGYDRNSVKIEDGALKNSKEFIAALKADPVHSLFFGMATIEGAEVGGSVGNIITDKPTIFKCQLDAARKANNTQDAVKIKTQAAKEGIYLI